MMGTSVRVALTQAGGAGGAHWARHALHLGERRGSLILLNKRDLEALMGQLQSQALADGAPERGKSAGAAANAWNSLSLREGPTRLRLDRCGEATIVS